jgi:hypothetical protein
MTEIVLLTTMILHHKNVFHTVALPPEVKLAALTTTFVTPEKLLLDHLTSLG